MLLSPQQSVSDAGGVVSGVEVVFSPPLIIVPAFHLSHAEHVDPPHCQYQCAQVHDGPPGLKQTTSYITALASFHAIQSHDVGFSVKTFP